MAFWSIFNNKLFLIPSIPTIRETFWKSVSFFIEFPKTTIARQFPCFDITQFYEIYPGIRIPFSPYFRSSKSLDIPAQFLYFEIVFEVTNTFKWTLTLWRRIVGMCLETSKDNNHQTIFVFRWHPVYKIYIHGFFSNKSMIGIFCLNYIFWIVTICTPGWVNFVYAEYCPCFNPQHFYHKCEHPSNVSRTTSFKRDAFYSHQMTFKIVSFKC